MTKSVNEDSAQRIIEGLEEAVAFAEGREDAARISIYGEDGVSVYDFDVAVPIVDDAEWEKAVSALTLITTQPSRSMAPVSAVLSRRLLAYSDLLG